MSPPPRLTELPLPPYTFVPGRRPHPHAGPLGHRHHPPAATVLDPARWQECLAYLYGIDLFNHGFYWEAHESWEGPWNAVGRRGPVADLLKALIQLAVAGVKHLEQVPEGVTKHARRSAELGRALAADGHQRFLGLPLDGLIALADAIHRDGWPAEAPVLMVASADG